MFIASLAWGYEYFCDGMAVQEHKSWGPVESGDGDLGTTSPPVDVAREDTAYYGHGGKHAQTDSVKQLSGYHDEIEMSEVSE